MAWVEPSRAYFCLASVMACHSLQIAHSTQLLLAHSSCAGIIRVKQQQGLKAPSYNVHCWQQERRPDLTRIEFCSLCVSPSSTVTFRAVLLACQHVHGRCYWQMQSLVAGKLPALQCSFRNNKVGPPVQNGAGQAVGRMNPLGRNVTLNAQAHV